MTIHEMFNTAEQELIAEALEKLRTHCKKIADAPVRGYGTAKEEAKKETWRDKQIAIEDLQSKILDLTI